MKKRYVCTSIVTVAIILLVVYEILGTERLGIKISEENAVFFDMIFTRGVGGIACTTLLAYLGYSVLNPFKKPFLKPVIVCVPAFVVAINNFHFYTFFTGNEKISGDVYQIILLAFECLCVGIFEEMTFRGVVFLSILERKRKNTKDLIFSIMVSSAIFGGIHAVNFLYSSPVAVIQQIGYSFLIGAMCSVILIKTSNIWICVLTHAVFNFCGALIPRLGEGFVWDVPTVVTTVLIAVVATVYFVIVTWCTSPDEVDTIFESESEKTK